MNVSTKEYAATHEIGIPPRCCSQP